jgi:DNA repair exonuclease SbcCD ATPase subunit
MMLPVCLYSALETEPSNLYGHGGYGHAGSECLATTNTKVNELEARIAVLEAAKAAAELDPRVLLAQLQAQVKELKAELEPLKAENEQLKKEKTILLQTLNVYKTAPKGSK